MFVGDRSSLFDEKKSGTYAAVSSTELIAVFYFRSWRERLAQVYEKRSDSERRRQGMSIVRLMIIRNIKV